MKVYISGPMNGKDYKNKFAMAETVLEEAGNVVANPAKVVKPHMSHRERREASRELLDMCDTILLLEGWHDCRECREDLRRALKNKMTIAFEGGKECQNPSRQEPEILHRKPVKKSMRGIRAVFSARKVTA